MNTISNSPNFKAKTIISTSDNLLSKKEIKELTKMGERIGLNNDSISYGIRQLNHDTFGVTHKSDFNINGNNLKTEKIEVHSIKDAKPFDIVKEQLKSLKSLYNNTISRLND